MDEFSSFDPSLFGTWAERATYDGKGPPEDPVLAAEVRRVLLEVKSAETPFDPAEELRRLLNEMTVEMREQFSTFRRMRSAAEVALESGDEAAQKLARADVKAATDAMSLIVRTLEKVDGLQRQLAHDREVEAERVADEGGYEEAKARFMKMIEERAGQQAERLYEKWKRDGPPSDVAERLPRRATQQAATATGCGEGGERDCQSGEAASRNESRHRDGP
jgi:hypothetical protein